jgi:hypothetical protein
VAMGAPAEGRRGPGGSLERARGGRPPVWSPVADGRGRAGRGRAGPLGARRLALALRRGRSGDRTVQRVVRALSALVGRVRGSHGGAVRTSPSSGSTSSTCLRSIRSDTRTARGRTTA